MKTRILSYLLVFSMILALLPASALAEGESTTQPHITATVEHALDSGGAETGQITAQIEAYLTDKDNQSRTVKPCDIIFLIEQSAFMNTQNDTTQYGQERADILNSMENLLQNLPAPTTGEHRVAIAGFGRINNSGSSDSYIESQHPGARLTTDQNPSLNTGYYTPGTDGSPVFHSQSGWTEWSRIPNNDETTLPQMPEGYLATESYDNVFMSIDKAEDVIDIDKMVSWHAGASRMDAGLQITKQLAEIAKEHKGEDRNLIIFVAASSLPYQNGIGVQSLRSEAAQAAATELKNNYNATIFGFGDFRPLTLQSGMSSEDQRTQFNETMTGICGNSNTLDGTPYFKGLSQVHDINEALNELLIQIDANVNPNAKSLNINVDNFQEKSTAHTSHTWKELKGKHHILTSSAINETASVDYYRFTGYDANGNPQFAATPFLRIERSLSDIGSGDSIQTALSLQPIPPVGTEGTAYGVKAVITITDPVCVDYKWAGRWTPDFDPPKHEHAARGVKHSPTTPEQNETTLDTMKLKFDGWYRLWDDSIDDNIDHEGNEKKTWTYDGKKYVAYQDTVYDAFGSDFTLYGRWIPSIDVNFQWIGSVIPEGAELPSTVSLPLSDSGTAFFTPAVPSQEGYEFDGWYKDSACTERYGENGENLTENTTLYGSWTRIGTKEVTFTVVNGGWNAASNWYKNTTQTNDTDTLTIEVPLRNGKGTLTPDLVPHVDNLDMKPAKGYKAPGTWGNNAPDTNADAITEDGTYAYTYTFPEADTYTITYRWVGTEVPEGVRLPAQQTEQESSAGKNPTFEIATVTSADKKWSFSGWYTNEALAGTAISDRYTFPEDNANDTKNLTLYGKWTHDPCTVTFYADYFQPAQGHFNTDDYSISYTVPYGSTLTKEQDTVPTPVTELATCYFEGWRDDYKTSLLDTEEEQEDTEEEQEDTQGEQEDTQDKPAAYSEDSTVGTFYTSKAIQDMTIKSDLNFVAQWWPIVTFNANGGDWELMEDRPTERYVPVPANSDHIDALRPPAREGYTFLGWYDSAENTSGEPIDFRTRTFKGAATVYAHWAKNATVTFKIVNGYWSGNTAEDKTVTVVLHPQANGSASGTLDANHVPAIMIPAAGYENTPGHWDVTPNTEENGISGNVTYTYIFGKKHHSSSDDNSNSSKDENKDKDNNKENNKDNNTGETTPTKVPALLNGSNHFAYVVGYKDGNVRPQGNITRAETAAIFFRLLKEEVRSENLSKHNDFADVTEDSWYNTAVSTMAGMNILKGRTANSFAPQAPITRAEFAAICARFDSGRAEENSGFTDISGHWAEKEIERAATLGWVSGYTDGSFHPDAPITRAEAMTLINRVLCRMPETKADLLDSMTKWPDNQPGAWYYLAVQEATNSHTYEQKDSKYETWTALTAEPDWSKY